jgi:arylsulfatase A-like enzyme
MKLVRTIIASLAILLVAPALASASPNIVVIQVDDMTTSQLVRQAMPFVSHEIQDKGTTFDRYYDPYPICCPSRTSLLTGQYPHNHGVLVNFAPYAYPGFKASPAFTSNVATWLQETGYRTIHVGKFLNQYGENDPSEVPPGWSAWHSVPGDNDARLYYGSRMNDNGVVNEESGYSTDVLTGWAVDEIEASTDQPFYLQVDYNAPHADAAGGPGPTPPERFAHAFPKARAPRGAAFNEDNVRDLPSFLRDHRLSPHQQRGIDQAYRNGLRSLRGVDQGVQWIFEALRRQGKLDDTYVFFLSDNGFFEGQHRFVAGKYLPFEPSARVPLLVRGLGIPQGGVSEELNANIDLAPTFLQIAGTMRPGIDGRSLLPYAEDPSKLSGRPILLEGFTGKPGVDYFPEGSKSTAPVTNYFGVVNQDWKFVHFARGGAELLYHLNVDPEETENLANRNNYNTDRLRLKRLATRLSTCKGKECR